MIDHEERIKILNRLRNGTQHKEPEDSFPSDQQLQKPQPAFFKAASGSEIISLPTVFDMLPMKNDFQEIIKQRKSSRFYTGEAISLLQLSFLLWASCGTNPIADPGNRPKRTFPSGGARYPFELYPLILNAEGLTPGFYHYLPQDHGLELLREIKADDDLSEFITASVCGQSWAAKASVILFFSMIPSRGEWRYGTGAHRVMLMDAGFAMENIYLSCSALNLGT